MKLGVSLIFLLSFLSHLALFRIFQTRIISTRKSQNPLIFGDYGFRLFFSFAEKTRKIPLCKLQICMKIKKNTKGEKHAEPSAAPDPRCFGRDHRHIAAKDRAGLTALGDKKGEDHQ